jgi:hypothetical protein
LILAALFIVSRSVQDRSGSREFFTIEVVALSSIDTPVSDDLL